MNKKEIMSKGYWTSDENAIIIESIIKRHRKRTERIM